MGIACIPGQQAELGNLQRSQRWPVNCRPAVVTLLIEKEASLETFLKNSLSSENCFPSNDNVIVECVRDLPVSVHGTSCHHGCSKCR